MVELLDTKSRHIRCQWVPSTKIEKDLVGRIEQWTCSVFGRIRTKRFKGQLNSRFEFRCFVQYFKILLLVQSHWRPSIRLGQIKHITIRHFIKIEIPFLGDYSQPQATLTKPLQGNGQRNAFICLRVCYSPPYASRQLNIEMSNL